MKGKTVLVVAHRLSTIAHLDRILVFDHGRIVEDGSHAELLAQQGAYYRLWSKQSDGFLSDSESGEPAPRLEKLPAGSQPEADPLEQAVLAANTDPERTPPLDPDVSFA
jgi:ATP-binding cassette subfamily B protein